MTIDYAIDGLVAPTAPSLPTGEQIAAHVERTGSWCLPDVVTDEWIGDVLAEVRPHMSSDEYEVILDNVDASPSTKAYEITRDPRILELLRTVVAAAAPGVDISGDSARTQIRIVVGEDPLDRPLNFHYDRSVVTMVIPLLMPTGLPGRSGELILVPNRRRFRRWVATNVVEKAIVQTARFRRRFIRAHITDTAIVPMSPGNAYLFWGYRSYHTTLPCPPHGERVTIILHFGEMHDGSGLLQLSKSAGRFWRLRRDTTVEVRDAG